jgi:hypothetical protein
VADDDDDEALLLLWLWPAVRALALGPKERERASCALPTLAALPPTLAAAARGGGSERAAASSVEPHSAVSRKRATGLVTSGRELCVAPWGPRAGGGLGSSAMDDVLNVP